MVAVTEYKTQGMMDFLSEKQFAALDVLSHVLQWTKDSKVLCPIVDARDVVYAAMDGLTTIEDTAGVANKAASYFSGSASGTEVLHAAKKASVSAGNFLSSSSDAVTFASTVGLMNSMPGLSTIGNIGGIYSKSCEIYNSYDNYVNESKKADSQSKDLKMKNIMFDILFRVSIIAIKILALAPVLFGMTFSAQAFLITTSLILISDIASWYFDYSYKKSIAS